MIIKFIHHNGKKRQTKVSKIPVFTDLRKLAIKIWGDSIKNCQFGYIDCDEELITVVNQDDWEVCVEEMESLQQDKKIEKIIVRILVNEQETNDSPQNESKISISPTEIVEVSRLDESIFKEIPLENNEVITQEPPKTIEIDAELVNKAIEASEVATEHPIELETDSKQLTDWKMVTQNSNSVKESEEGDSNISEEAPENKEEESIFEDSSAPVRVINTNPEDCLIDIKVDGNNLEAVRQQVLKLAPFMGFEVEKAEIIPAEDKEEIKENNLADISLCETNRSSMTCDMRDEIQKMIQEKVKEELSKSMIQTETKKTSSKCETIHYGFTCDGCRVCPIVGIRYNSLIQKNYDLCENCESKMHEEHPMIRFRQNTHRGLANGKAWSELHQIMNRKKNPVRRNRPGRCGRARPNRHHHNVIGTET